MKSLFILLAIASMLFSACTNSTTTLSQNADPRLVGKWVRQGKYHLELYSNGTGSNKKNVSVTTDIKKFKKSRINWATLNNTFLLINYDEQVMGLSYQLSGDTLFIRQPEDDLEYFLRVKDEKDE